MSKKLKRAGSPLNTELPQVTVMSPGPATQMSRQRGAIPTVLAHRYQSGCWRVIEAAGELDIQSVPCLRGLVAGDPTHVVFDVRRVTFLDASVLGMFAATRGNQGRAHGAVRVTGASPQIRKMLAITRLDQVLTICESFDEAFSGHDSC